jgi:hypothetical protein
VVEGAAAPHAPGTVALERRQAARRPPRLVA